jgi:hypothetical protein
MTSLKVNIVCAVLLPVAIALGIIALSNGEDRPDSAPVQQVQWQQPYGGCDEAANYPWTRGWRQCVKHGAITVSLRPCWTEAGPSPCVWDARHLGNGDGDSVIIRVGNRSPRTVSHRMAHTLVKNWEQTRTTPYKDVIGPDGERHTGCRIQVAGTALVH